MTRTTVTAAVAAASLLLPGVVRPANADEAPSAYDRIWDVANLWESDQATFFRSFSLSGRVHLDAVHFEEDSDDFDDFTWRRFRFGFKSKIHDNWLVHLEYDFDLNESLGDSFNRLTDGYLAWEPDSGGQLKMLKHSAGFTLDGATSSNRLLTLQRSNLANNLWFTDEYFTGVSFKGEDADGWRYKAGIFSNEDDDGISRLKASYFTLASLGYDLGSQLGIDRALVRFDHVYNDRDPDRATPDFSSVASLSTQLEHGNIGLWTDLATGHGDRDQSDLWGFSLMPFYRSSERFQWVIRYTYIDSDGPNGVRLGRYHGEVTAGRGDRYSELYGGLNVFFYGHNLKWQTGIEYAELADRAEDGGDHYGWGITTGLRIHW